MRKDVNKSRINSKLLPLNTTRKNYKKDSPSLRVVSVLSRLVVPQKLKSEKLRTELLMH